MNVSWAESSRTRKKPSKSRMSRLASGLHRFQHAPGFCSFWLVLACVPAPASAVTLDEVVALSKSGVSEPVIVALIERDQTLFTMSPDAARQAAARRPQRHDPPRAHQERPPERAARSRRVRVAHRCAAAAYRRLRRSSSSGTAPSSRTRGARTRWRSDAPCRRAAARSVAGLRAGPDRRPCPAVTRTARRRSRRGLRRVPRAHREPAAVRRARLQPARLRSRGVDACHRMSRR